MKAWRYNPGVSVSAMTEVNLQGMIFYIKHIKRIGHTCTHIDVDLFEVRAMYCQQDMEEVHKDPEVLPNSNPRDWPKTLDTVEEYSRIFHGVDGQPLIYGLRGDLIAPVDANDPTYHDNRSE